MDQKQHYVPRFLLEHFAAEGGRLFVYDKHTERHFSAVPQQVAREGRFYELDLGNVRATMEPTLSAIETSASAIIKRIITEKALKGLSWVERVHLAQFCAVQFLRGPAVRQSLRAVANDLAVREAEPGQVPDLPTEDDIKFVATNEIRHDRIEKWVRLFLDKKWVLCESSAAVPFYISDNPITLFHEDENKWIGLAVQGIQIHFPIHPQLCLGMYCSTIESDARSMLEWAERMPITLRAEREIADSIAAAEQLVRAFAQWEVVPLAAENVKHINSQQVMFATRFVYSSTGDLESARRVARWNPQLKRGIIPRRVF